MMDGYPKQHVRRSTAIQILVGNSTLTVAFIPPLTGPGLGRGLNIQDRHWKIPVGPVLLYPIYYIEEVVFQSQRAVEGTQTYCYYT